MERENLHVEVRSKGRQIVVPKRTFEWGDVLRRRKQRADSPEHRTPADGLCEEREPSGLEDPRELTRVLDEAIGQMMEDRRAETDVEKAAPIAELIRAAHGEVNR